MKSMCVLILISFSACSVAVKKAKEAADKAAGKAVASQVEKKDPELAAAITEAATAKAEAGETWAWLRTLGEYWWQIALALGLSTEASRRLRKALKERNVRGVLLQVMSAAIARLEGSEAKDQVGAALDDELDARGLAGSMRNHMRAAKVPPS